MRLLAQQSAALPSDLRLAFVLLDIAIIIVMARIVGGLAVRVGQPRVVGEIVAGIVLGPSLLGATIFQWDDVPDALHCDVQVANGATPSITTCLFPAEARGVLGVLGQIALVFFMFLVGTELDWRLLKGKGKAIMTVGFAVVLVPVAAAFAIGPFLYDEPRFVGVGDPSKTAFILFVGAMLSVTAFPVMAKILQEKRLSSSPMGSVGIAAAALVTVLMFLVVAVASGTASGKGGADHVEKFVIAAVYLAVMFGPIRVALRPLERRYERRGGIDAEIFAVCMALAFGSAYAADRIGINVIVGGFVAGAILPARAPLFRDLQIRLADVTGVVLLPIFLAFSGLQTDFTRLSWDDLPGIGLFLVTAIAAKWLSGAVAGRASGLSWAEGNVLGVLMNCRGLLVLVVGLIAFNQGIISPPLQVGAVLVALVTTAMTGPLFDLFSRSLPQAPAVVEAELLATGATGPAGGPAAETPVPTPAEPASQTVRTDGRGRGLTVLAVVDEPELAPSIVHTAFALVEGLHGSEVVVSRPFIVTTHDGLFSAGRVDEAESQRLLRLLRGLTAAPPAHTRVSSTASAVADVAAEVLEMAAARPFDAVVLGWPRASLPDQATTRLIRSLRLDVGVDVVFVCDRGAEPARPDAPVVVAGPASPRAVDVADRLADRFRTAVDRAPGVGRDAALLHAASARARVLVLAADPDGTPMFDRIPEELLTEAGCPIVFVGEHLAPVSHDLATAAQPSP